MQHSNMLTAALVSALTLLGCRADVEGYWSGNVGEEAAFLSLQQAGSQVRGEACLAGACDPHASGEIVEGRLTLRFGCRTCSAPPEVELDLAVNEDEMDGIAILEGCSCGEGDCGCGRSARFTRTPTYQP